MKNIFNGKNFIDFWITVQNDQKLLVEKTLRNFIPYCTTYRYEQVFPTNNCMKNKCFDFSAV